MIVSTSGDGHLVTHLILSCSIWSYDFNSPQVIVIACHCHVMVFEQLVVGNPNSIDNLWVRGDIA
ncbi:MAG: hypothetical protein IJ613_03155 [Muribaculaceae bacterium]|nr:hypothetical protein [Muribaculaceae bacterium]